MRRVAIIFLIVTAVGALTAAPASATPSQHLRDTVDVAYPLDHYSQLCGFPVAFRLTGRIDSSVFFDRNGAVVREVDTQPGATVTFSSPNGSFTFPFASTLVTTYANGAALGAPAVATGSGLAGKVPGIPADAGRITYSGVVVDFSPAGIPIVAFTGVVSMTGHANDPAVEDAAICKALD